MKKDDFTFDGFEPANTTPVPDVLFDELLAILSGAELKVLLYIIRRTAGFKKPTDAISLTQFERGITTKAGKVLDRGCGLNRETVCQALQSLENRGCIRLTKRMGTKNDKDVTIYRIRFRGDVAVVGKTDYVLVGQSEKPTTLVGKTDYPSRKNPLGVVGKTDPQETVQDTDSQETVQQEGERVGALAPTAPAFPEPEYHFYGTQHQHLIWNCHNWCAVNHGTCEDYVAAIEAGLHESPTDKVPIVPPGNVTGVTYSQPVYRQGEDDDTDTLAAARAAHSDSDPDARRAGTSGTRRDHAEAGNVEAASRARAVPETAEAQDIAPMAETPLQIRKRVDRRADDLLALYCALMGDKVTRSKENMEAMRELAQLDRTDEEVTLVMRNILDDPDDFLARQLTPRKLATNFTARLRTARGTPVQPPPKPTPPVSHRRNFSEEYREEMLQARRGNV